MPALLLQSEAGGMLANGFTVLCLLSSGGGVERSSGSLPGRPNVVSGVAGTCPRATPVTRRSAVGMAHKRSIRLQCMMSLPTQRNEERLGIDGQRPGNGTAFSAVAPSERPVSPPIDPISSGVVL